MKLILGTMNIDYPHSSNIDKSQEYYSSIIKKYMELVDDPILDTAYYYSNTKTEQILGNILETYDKKPKIATKANPWFDNDFSNGKFGQLSSLNLETQLLTSLNNLKLDKVDIFYLHCWDYETDINETLQSANDLWRREKYDEFGISNFSKEQLLSVIDIIEKNGYNKLSYYQGMYNLISKKVEEIFTIIDDNNIEFWAYNPLAGGLLTGKYRNKDLNTFNSRFNNNTIYQNIFYKPEIINGFDNFFSNDNCIKYSFDWLTKYSKLRQSDSIILGVSTIEQLEENFKTIKKNEQLELGVYYDVYEKYKQIENQIPNYYY